MSAELVRPLVLQEREEQNKAGARYVDDGRVGRTALPRPRPGGAK